MKITSNAEAAVVYSKLLIRAVCCQISPTCLTSWTVKLSGHFCSGFYFARRETDFLYIFFTDSCVDIKESVELLRHQGLLDCVRLCAAIKCLCSGHWLYSSRRCRHRARCSRAAAQASALCTIVPPAFMLCRKKLRPPNGCH